MAEIYIKKGALDEAAEVLQEVLASDPDNAQARQKLQEVNERRGQQGAAPAPGVNAIQEAKEKQAADARKRAEEEAKLQAEAAARKKAEDEAEAARKKAEEDAKAKAEAEARKKAEEEAKAKAEAEAKAKAELEARQKAEEEAKAKAAEEARQKAEEAAKAEAEAHKKAEEAAKRQAEDDAKAQAEDEARKKAEEAAKQREQEEKDRKASKLSSDDILSVMTSSSDDLISEEPPIRCRLRSRPGASGQAPVASGITPEARAAIDEFLRAQAMEASLLLDAKGAVIESKLSGDAAALGATAGAIFSNTEKAAQRMAFGGLKQIMIVGEDTRQILFVALKSGVLVALTGRNTNLGLLRVAVNDLVKRA